MWETEENIKILNVLERVVGINTSSPSTAWIWKLFSKYEVCVCCLQWTMEIFEKLKQKLLSKQCRLLVSRCSGATGGLETWVDMGGGDTESDNVERGWPRVAWSSDTASVVKHTLCPPWSSPSHLNCWHWSCSVWPDHQTFSTVASGSLTLSLAIHHISQARETNKSSSHRTLFSLDTTLSSVSRP